MRWRQRCLRRQQQCLRCGRIKGFAKQPANRLDRLVRSTVEDRPCGMSILNLFRIQSRSCLVAWPLLLGLVGCAHRQPTREIPTRPLLPFSATGQVEMHDRWWTAFGDPALNRQVEQALGDNLTLAVAFQRLRAAQAVARREASDLFPDVDGIITTDSIFGSGPDRTGVVWGLDAAYQVDLWGQIQSRVEAERLRAEATCEDYHTVALSLAAEVVARGFL